MRVDPTILGAIRQAVAEAADQPLLLGQAAAIRLSGLSRSAWYRMRSAGRAPRPVAIAGVGLRWKRRQIEKWVESLE